MPGTMFFIMVGGGQNVTSLKAPRLCPIVFLVNLGCGQGGVLGWKKDKVMVNWLFESAAEDSGWVFELHYDGILITFGGLSSDGNVEVNVGMAALEMCCAMCCGYQLSICPKDRGRSQASMPPSGIDTLFLCILYRVTLTPWCIYDICS